MSPHCGCSSGASGVAGPEHVGDGGQLFEIQLDVARQILRLGPRFSHAGGDRLAGVADALGGEHRLFGDLESGQPGTRDDRTYPGEICGGEHPPFFARGLRHAPRSRAWASGLRTNATSIVPGIAMSATNSPRPCSSR